MKRITMMAVALVVAAPLYAQNIATVNGQAITQKSYDQFVQLLVTQGAPDSPKLREQVKEEMINRAIMVQAAEKAGINKLPAVETELDVARQSILLRAYMADYLAKNPINETAIAAEYDKLKKAQDGVVEYDVRHILVDDEKVANDLQTQIMSKKAKFEDLAKANSKDTGSAAKGGSLGWADASNYVAPFAEAVKATPKGQLADKPVQSQFGWHIIEVVDVRPVAFPPLDQVKPQLEEMMRQQEIAALQTKLRESATVK